MNFDLVNEFYGGMQQEKKTKDLEYEPPHPILK